MNVHFLNKLIHLVFIQKIYFKLMKKKKRMKISLNKKLVASNNKFFYL